MKDGIHFPTDLINQSAVAYVLRQQRGKMNSKEVKEAVKSQAGMSETSKQMKVFYFFNFSMF